MRKRIIVPLLGCLGACGSPQQPAPAPTLANTAPIAPPPTAEPVETAEPTSEPPGPKVLSQQEIATFCTESCDRNGKLCAEIDVQGCTDNCKTAFGAVTDFCPGRLGAFVECVKQDPLRCKAGAKIRTENCDAESAAITMCLGLYSVPEKDRCVMQCEEFGQCEIVDGVCTATVASCAKLEKCKAKDCKVVDAQCEPID